MEHGVLFLQYVEQLEHLLVRYDGRHPQSHPSVGPNRGTEGSDNKNECLPSCLNCLCRSTYTLTVNIRFFYYEKALLINEKAPNV